MAKGTNRLSVAISTKQALAVLESLPTKHGWVFPSTHHGKHISKMAMSNTLKSVMKRPNLTVHGF